MLLSGFTCCRSFLTLQVETFTKWTCTSDADNTEVHPLLITHTHVYVLLPSPALMTMTHRCYNCHTFCVVQALCYVSGGVLFLGRSALDMTPNGAGIVNFLSHALLCVSYLVSARRQWPETLFARVQPSTLYPRPCQHAGVITVQGHVRAQLPWRRCVNQPHCSLQSSSC